MSSATRTSTGGRLDPQLMPFLEAVSEAEAMAMLERLLADDLDRLVRDVVGRELGSSAIGGPHVQDVLADVRVRLIAKLWRLRANPDEAPVESLPAYATVAARNTCFAFLR